MLPNNPTPSPPGMLPEQVIHDRTNSVRLELQNKVDKKLDLSLFIVVIGIIITAMGSSFVMMLKYNEDRSATDTQLKEQIARLEIKNDDHTAAESQLKGQIAHLEDKIDHIINK